MLNAVLKNLNNEDVGSVDISPDIFSQPAREDILHRVVVWQLAKRRSGCHKVKHRAEISLSTKKLYKQKGTGNARHGSAKAPIFVGGGVVFGPLVRSHEHKLNKKIRLLGLRIALSLKHSNGDLVFIDSANLSSFKTCDFKEVMDKFSCNGRVLILDDGLDQNLINASSNLHKINILDVAGLNVLSILKGDKVFVTKKALEVIEKRLAC